MHEFTPMEPFSGTVKFEADGWQKLLEQMDDLNVSETPEFTLKDKYGNEAVYRRDPREGEWIEQYTEIKCSCCGSEFTDEVTCSEIFGWPWEYCPKCYARMKVGWSYD